MNTPPPRYKGLTALQGAAMGGHAAILETLLDAGADVDVAGSYYGGFTALAVASSSGHSWIVRRLLEAGADPKMTSGNKSLTPLCIANFKDHREIIKILQDAEES